MNFRRHFIEQSLKICNANKKFLIAEEKWILDEVEKLGIDTVMEDQYQGLRNDLNDITRRFQ